MARADFSGVGAYRDPTPEVWPDEPQWQRSAPRERLAADALEDMIQDHPDIAAELLRQCGLDERDFMQALAYDGRL